MTTTGNAVWNTVGAAGTVGAAVVGGVFFTFSTFVGQALRAAPTGAAVSTMQAINVAAVRPPLMLAIFGTALLGIAAAVHAVRTEGGAAWPTVTGVGLCVVGTVGTTIAWNVPRNDQLATWEPATATAQQWLSWLSAWEAGNHVRTATSSSRAHALASPPRAVETLLVPLQASWLATSQGVEFLRTVGYARAVGIHDGQINARAVGAIGHWYEQGSAGRYRYVEPGTAVPESRA